MHHFLHHNPGQFHSLPLLIKTKCNKKMYVSIWHGETFKFLLYLENLNLTSTNRFKHASLKNLEFVTYIWYMIWVNFLILLNKDSVTIATILRLLTMKPEFLLCFFSLYFLLFPAKKNVQEYFKTNHFPRKKIKTKNLLTKLRNISANTSQKNTVH